MLQPICLCLPEFFLPAIYSPAAVAEPSPTQRSGAQAAPSFRLPQSGRSFIMH